MIRRLALVLSACALALATVASVAACGDDAGDPPSGTTTAPGPGTAATGSSAAATAPASRQPGNTSEPILAPPASQYSLLLADVGEQDFITDISSTLELDAAGYGATKLFPSAEDGEAKMKDWGYLGGYETAMWPEGREDAMLNGAFIIAMEVHLFATTDGANGFYDYWLSRIQAAGVGQPIKADAVGNESKAFKALGDKIRNSNIVEAHHQVVFRRGNLVVVLQTIGADPFMTVTPVVALANLVDRKALGDLAVVAPTPTSNFTPNAGRTPPSPTATP